MFLYFTQITDMPTKKPQTSTTKIRTRHFSFREREMLDAIERLDPAWAIATRQAEGTVAEWFSSSFL